MGEFVSALGNPWMWSEFNVTTQGLFLLRYGERRARQFADEALKANNERRVVIENRTFIMTKKIGSLGGGSGSSGVGPPA